MTYLVSSLIIAGGITTSTQSFTIAGFDPMAWVALILVVMVILYLLSCITTKGYTCKECNYWTPDRQDAAGHQHLHSLHKFDL